MEEHRKTQVLANGEKNSAAHEKSDQKQVDDIVCNLPRIPVVRKEIFEKPERRADYS